MRIRKIVYDLTFPRRYQVFCSPNFFLFFHAIKIHINGSRNCSDMLLGWFHWFYKGMLPCFLGGILSLLLANILSERMIFILVWLGSITSSIIPLLAATYGFIRFSLYSDTNSSVSFWGSSDSLSFYRSIMFTAPSPPITATSPVGQE